MGGGFTGMTSKYQKNADGLYVCPHCDETKARANTMYYHILKHSGEVKHTCPVDGCGKGFIQKSGLTQHMNQVHADLVDASVFACPCCDHTARQKPNLLIHIGRKHGDDWIPRPEAGAGATHCKGCDKEFQSATAYYYHAVACFRDAAPKEIAAMIANAEGGVSA